MDLSNLTKPKSKPPILTIVGTPGVGKSTLAALFPSPVFIQAEDGAAVFDTWEDDAKPVMFPPLPRTDKEREISTFDTLMEQLRALATQEHDFKTVVLDAATSLHALFETEVCLGSGTDNIGEACGGYGKGYLAVKEMHAKVKDAFDYLRNRRGMTVVFLAHAGIKKMRNRPDSEEHTVFSLDMHDASIATYTNLVDAVLYLRQEEFVSGGQTDKKGQTSKFGKVVQTGNRVLVTSGDGRVGYANAKNRMNFEPEIPVPQGENPLLEFDDGYVKVNLFGVPMRVHRIIYCMLVGPIPDGYDIDHINGNRSDNRIKNLRLALRSQNLHNSKAHKDNQLGVKGVYYNKRNKNFTARVMCRGKNFFSVHQTVESAVEWLDKKRKELHGAFAKNQ
jgi:hypothetical protein